MKISPIRYDVASPSTSTRVQLLARVVAFFAIGTLGLTFGGVLWAAYLLLPVAAAVRLSARDATRYPVEDGPWIVNALRWFAAGSAWMALITDRLPMRMPTETLTLEIDVTARPTATSAMWRLFTGLPSLFVLAVLGVIGTFVWMWAALTILVRGKIGPGAFWYLAGLQRWCIWLLAYQASLVDAYPPFSLGDAQTARRDAQEVRRAAAATPSLSS